MLDAMYTQRVLNATHIQRVRTDSHSVGNQNSNLRTVRLIRQVTNVNRHRYSLKSFDCELWF